jgi:galactokinase
MIEKILDRFQAEYNAYPSIYRSPGRVNILGEHTDYNHGFVLPAAIDMSMYVAISLRADNMISLIASAYDEKIDCSLDNLKPTSVQWPNYVLGIVDQLQKIGAKLGGFNMVINGEIPLGAGLSSSAAIGCSVIYALNDMFQLNLQKLEMVHLAQQSENVFAGVKCGIMDQFASIYGKVDSVIKLDCESLEYEYIPFNLEGIKIVLFNTNVKHSLAFSEYNTRRQECEAGVNLIRKIYKDIETLRDVDMEMLDKYVYPVDQLIYKRCRYVIEEYNRLLEACEDLVKGDIHALGKKMYETHHGLSKSYEVSCKELDYLVDFVKKEPSVLGARMMGGGFGGCTINLVREDAVEELTGRISAAYEQEMKLPLSTYIAQISNGASKVF